MGLLVDRLAETLERLRRLQSQLIHGGQAIEASRLQHHLVGRLEQVVLQIDGSSVDARAERLAEAVEAIKVRFPKSRGGKGIRKKGRRKPGKLVWLCCGEPKRSTNRKGKPIWVAACTWKKGDRRGQTIRVVGMGSSKPRAVTLKGRRIKRCQKTTVAPAQK
jgi:hypothetical protein